MQLKSAVVLLCALWALAQGSDPATSSISDSVDPPFGPDGPIPIIPPGPNITTSSTTTPKPTVTTTIKPHTTTTSTTTTTTSTTTTTTPKTTTSTSTSTTTTTSKPTPKPDDKPAINNYIGNYTGSNYICFMARMAVQAEILVDKKNSTMLNVPKTAMSTVLCPRNDYESLNVTWDTNNSVSFEFVKNNSRYDIQSINATVLIPGKNSTTTYYHIKPEFSVPDKLSYFCTKDQPLNMTDNQSNVTIAKIHLSSVHLQAFMNTTDANYASVWNCDGANTPDVVPVVVGCVLAILVVLVLVVYLFGRRRCQARGYLSMFAEEKNESDYIPMKTLSCFK